MKIIKHLQLNETEIELFQNFPCVIALGTFDGLHEGHQDVILSAGRYAREHGLQLAVFTFSNHPYAAINPTAIPPLLISPEEKFRKLKEWGVELLIDIPFNKELSILSAKDFLQRLKRFNFRALVCGANFSYGFRGTGNTVSLQQCGKIQGFDVIVRPLYCYQGETVSSTRIRRTIAEGKLADAKQMLGRFYSVQGIVQKGFQRGRRLGFPTANIPVDRSGSALPPSGTYVMAVRDGDRLYQGVGNLGMNPTFDDVLREVLEVHLFDCREDLYGHVLEASFCKFLRNEQRFSSVEELKVQLEKDKAAAHDWFLAEEAAEKADRRTCNK